MNIPSKKSKEIEIVVALGPRQLPFETWRPIFQIVYAAKTAISHPPSDFVFSPLHSRLNVYRNLALVCRSWHANARDVFFEELHAHSAEALKGIILAFQKDRPLGLAVSRISFSFYEFRCSASLPRRPRRLRPATDPEPEVAARTGEDRLSPATRPVPDWKSVQRRDYRAYAPSTASQASHWTRWQADVGQILSMCTSLSEVEITFTSKNPHQFSRFSRYQSFFAPPDLTNEKILDGLLHSSNLRKLHLVDPAPLERYGPALASWKRLGDLSIVLTRSFDELQETAFIPPKSLVSFRFHDRSSGRIPWPLASDLARCTNLQKLDLGVTSLANTQTSQAIGFLCSAYAHSLRELTLDLIHGHEEQYLVGFRDILESLVNAQFSQLESLRLLQASYATSIFSYFNADGLKDLEVGWLELEPGPGSREDKWSRGLRHPSLKALKQLTINRDDPDEMRKQALNAVCERQGITLITGRTSRNAEDLASEGGEDPYFDDMIVEV